MRMRRYFERKGSEYSKKKHSYNFNDVTTVLAYSSFYSTHIDFFILILFERGGGGSQINLIERVYGKDSVSKGLKIENKHFSSRQQF